MKELTKKILSAGLIDKTTAVMMSRWGMLSPEEMALITPEQKVQESLELFTEELEILLQPEQLERPEVVLKED